MSDYVLTREIRDMRVAVSKDFLESLVDSRVRVKSKNTYVAAPKAVLEAVRGKDLQEVVGEVGPQRTVCHLGGCLLSLARLYDEVPGDELLAAGNCYPRAYVGVGDVAISYDYVVGQLSRVFDPLTTSMLESAFEKCVSSHEEVGIIDRDDDRLDLLRGAAVFGRSYAYDGARAEAVLRNMIANDGEFVVDPVVWVLYDADDRDSDSALYEDDSYYSDDEDTDDDSDD